MMPSEYNFAIVRGSAGPGQGLTIRLKTGSTAAPVSMDFDDVRLTISRGSTLIMRHTIGNGRLVVTDADEAEITWAPTTEETRLIPLGPTARYELEVRVGDTEAVYMRGKITGVGGINDDEDDEVS